jgi:hypothetical protein
LPPITIVHGRSRSIGPRTAAPEAASTSPNNPATSRSESPKDQR